ncbi:UDP-glucose/GDP-mannose dehydrogenase family protein [Litoribacter ruber]|uniref:UDP-glucose 6-dehydrogenase n=1 Tax=Litoribacter ruber TaxID=702568 RepID=A0AAP2CGK3_9BACT|nr:MULTISPECIES: UDP-glucose/GDP-mannose dehydrogenase family protein [Litoribacter]MBS9524263.1 UDP-glucose/GDP-mannose dehydrogenase family protein [Litoribacter alkaliphilus]MBT0809939.1 UDP-glucose/GDP-mannose dehydrogenase family protein [Litoribacter ruber]
MKISVFGLGYVGCVSLGCLAKNGHHLTGVDVNSFKVDLINKGQPTILEKDIDTIIKDGHEQGRIKATLDAKAAVMETDLSIICVGTPSSPQGHLNLSYIFKTAEQIGEALKDKDRFHVITIRSTVLPGTNEKFGKIVEEFSGKERGKHFSVVSNPEFLREGTAVKDYYNPSVTVVGGDHEQALEMVASLYQELDAPIKKTDIKIAEIIKYVNNSYHALKIVFANEVGNICKSMDIDSHKVMELFCSDTHLNISPAYFKPGFAYGGSCLPKDLKGLVTLGHDNYLYTPVLSGIEASNENQKKSAFELVTKSGKKNICFVGLSFKEGTDDLRYSPSVDLAEMLIGKGYNITIYDENVHMSKLIGANEAYINERLPHLSELLSTDLEEAIKNNDVIIVNHRNFEGCKYFDLLKEKEVIDLVRVDELKELPQYAGLCW